MCLFSECSKDPDEHGSYQILWEIQSCAARNHQRWVELTEIELLPNICIELYCYWVPCSFLRDNVLSCTHFILLSFFFLSIWCRFGVSCVVLANDLVLIHLATLHDNSILPHWMMPLFNFVLLNGTTVLFCLAEWRLCSVCVSACLWPSVGHCCWCKETHNHTSQPNTQWQTTQVSIALISFDSIDVLNGFFWYFQATQRHLRTHWHHQ